MSEKKRYIIKAKKNVEPLGMNKTLDERLSSIGWWFANGDINLDNYLWCLETAFEHWGWTPPKVG